MNSTLNPHVTSPNPFTPFPKTPTFNFSFPRLNHHHNHRRRRFQPPFTVTSSLINNPHAPFNPPTTAGLNSTQKRQDKVLIPHAIKQILKPISITVLWIVIGLCPIQGFNQNPAIAAPVISEILKDKRSKGKENVQNRNDHEFSEYTRRLLETVSKLVRVIEEVRSGNGDLENVNVALNDVKLKKKELQDEIMSKLYAELSVLRGKKTELDKKSGAILDSVMKSKRERDRVLEKAGDKKAKDRVAVELDEVISEKEKEFMVISEEVGEIEDQMSVKETMALSIGVRELCFIERESSVLVENFVREMKRKDNNKMPQSSHTKLSRSEIKKELQTAQKQFWEQTVLSKVVENDDIEFPFDQNSIEFSRRVKQALAESREMQKNLEANIRKKMKKFGDEKYVILNSPVEEIVKGYPEVESKWTFGEKEVVVPKAARAHLFHGWKKWRDEAKKDLKEKVLEDVEFGKKYVAERQEKILLDRDRVLSKTWYNEERNRWEMEPIAVPYAVSQKLVESARIRHDWAAMFMTLKGDDKEYYVDLKEYDSMFEDFGGVDGLYLKMLASNVPTFVQLMWIPFSELDIKQQFLLPMRLSRQALVGLWNARDVSTVDWIFNWFKNITQDIMVLIVCPLLELIVPTSVKIKLFRTIPMKQYLNWKSEAEENIKSQKEDEEFNWYFMFAVRAIVYWYILSHVFRFLKKRTPKLPGLKARRRNPNMRKLRRLKYFYRAMLRGAKAKKKEGVDPITHAFDKMKRVKNPPIRLKDFASVEFMREEINEVIAFLQNPRAFQEMGARAPRGVLIVGERGTGKTALAMAIAAEAKVPVVEVKAQQLEAGLWVGQSASNVRELFQTARDLAPVIIFVEDFDLFAGKRGKFIHTKKQDHEAFINQLLVELDGFEKQDGVVLMATTQNLKKIDEALQRPGRMDRIFHLQLPTQAERERILQIAAKETMDPDLVDFVDWQKVAEKTALLRPVELKLVPVALEGSAFRTKFLDRDELLGYTSFIATFSNSIPSWLRKTKLAKAMSKMLVDHLGLTLTREDLQNVVDLMEPYGQITNGIEYLNVPLDWTRETKFPHAVWVAGRGLIAALLPNYDVVDNLWLEPLSWEGIGCTKITKAKTGGSAIGNVESRSYLEKKLVFCFGSYVASQMLLPFGEENILSSSELNQAQEIATRMVIQYGWGPDDSPVVYHHGNAVTALSMGDNYEYEMAAKVEKMYDLAYEKAKSILWSNRIVLEKIVEELLESEILTGKDLERIISANGGVRETEPFYLGIRNEEPVFGSLLEDGNGSQSVLLSAAN
ncbi:putative peptidase M41, AAA+ ATPase domain, ATPase, AAA-type, core [Helianthus annuus]|nr:putative peptidase M41, AAA+ ATPase domain, ATPase, AAA-type, core [Helianthus annuus]KAJ0825126.1 putative peptidase M41, AAA+ ATPase domain, ATPase, AAA-type, core [Helianthus annuus]